MHPLWSSRVAVVLSLAYGFDVAVPLVGVPVTLLGFAVTLVGVAVSLVGLVVPLVGLVVALVGLVVTVVGEPVALSRPVVSLVRECMAKGIGGNPLQCVLGASSAGLVAVGRTKAALALEIGSHLVIVCGILVAVALLVILVAQRPLGLTQPLVCVASPLLG